MAKHFYRGNMGYSNENKGVLFKNKKKETDKHPDYNGSINVNGQEFWLNAWINQSEKGVKYMSISVKAKEDKPQNNQPSGYNDGDLF
jgi:uncharacterized protein (DUF736 family)